ncbi:MAG: hypothetical protein WBP05_05505 [Nitrospira sp.]
MEPKRRQSGPLHGAVEGSSQVPRIMAEHWIERSRDFLLLQCGEQSDYCRIHGNPLALIRLRFLDCKDADIPVDV